VNFFRPEAFKKPLATASASPMQAFTLQGLRILFFIWASRRGLGADASKRRTAYFFIWASQRGLGDDASLVLTV